MRFFTILVILLPILAKAQPCSNVPGMNPSTAIAVCGTSNFQQPSVQSCTGPNMPSSTSGCNAPVTSNSSYWYKFHCYQTGTLGFLITPSNATNDYDWEVFDITGHPANDVYSFESMRLSLNLSGVPGTTGCTAAGSGNIHCEGGSAGTQYNAMPLLVAGSDYLLMVTNYASTGFGYTLNFSGGTAVITDPLPPGLDHLENGCSNTAIKVFFTKDVRCSSVTSTGSEFTIMPGNIPAGFITSQCSAGNNSITQLTVNSSVPLTPGNYTLVINNGSDGNTFRDACGNDMPPGTSLPFHISPQTPAVISNVSFGGCAPVVLTVDLDKPVLCSSITATGSELSITPGNPGILSVQSADCNSGATYTKTLVVTMQNPLPFGNYQLAINNGTDGNTYLDTCGILVVPGTSAPVNISAVSAPQISLIDFNQCRPNEVTLHFDKLINCGSISANASEFVINPGNIAPTSLNMNCGTGGYTSSITLVMLNPLAAGNHTVLINTGADGSTISDTCFAFIAPGYSVPFTSTLPPAPVFDSVQYDKCNPSFIKVFYNHPIQCNTISPDGSDFNITGPSSVNIVSAAGDNTCASAGYTQWVLLQFAQGISVNGNYLLHNKIGTDGNGLMDTCNALQNTNETIPVAVSIKPSAVYNYTVKWGCTQDTIQFSHPGGGGIVSWNWTFSDNTSSSVQNISHIFPANLPSATVQLIVSNGQCMDTSTVTIPLGNAFSTIFSVSPGDTVCIGNTVTFSNNSSGNNLSYQWSFGDNSSFNGANPPAHVYAAPSAYQVELIAVNNHGCADTARDVIEVSNLPMVDFAGLKPRYCSGDIVTLNAVLQGNFSSYTWDNGDGKTFLNKPRISFSYSAENAYTVKLAAIDKYCGSVEKSHSTFVFKTPVVILGNDTALCPNTSISIGIAGTSPYQLLWNTGETTPQIITKLISMQYKLIADNNGCTGAASINITMRSNCLIKVPNAFTPNNDGLNDKLKAINADFDLTKLFSFSIYNRLGNLVFSTNDPLLAWDGKYRGQPAETGTYVWQLSYTDRRDGKQVYEKGTTILIR